MTPYSVRFGLSLVLISFVAFQPAWAETKEPVGFDRACAEIKCGHCGLAHKHLMALAKKGHAKSQTLVAIMYRDGIGVEKSASKSAQWFEKAAQQGLKEAENGLGHLYLSGDEAVRNQALAEKWLTRAAEHGVMEAQRDLGKMLLLKGDLAGRDHDIAVSWLKRAANQGSGEARKVVDSVPGADKVEDVIAQGQAQVQQSGQGVSQGVGNIEQSWEGYSDLVTSMRQASAGPQ